MIPEELTSLETDSHQQQEKLLQEYCSNLDNKILTAASKNEAIKIVEELCGRFRHYCSSEILLRQMDKYVHQLIEKHWRSQRQE